MIFSSVITDWVLSDYSEDIAVLLSQPLGEGDIDLAVLPLNLHLALGNVVVVVARTAVHIEAPSTDVLVGASAGAHQNSLFEDVGDQLGSLFLLALPSLFPLALLALHLLLPLTSVFFELFQGPLRLQQSLLTAGGQGAIGADVVLDNKGTHQTVSNDVSAVGGLTEDGNAAFEGVRECHLCIHNCICYCLMYIFTKPTA